MALATRRALTLACAALMSLLTSAMHSQNGQV
eukprot:CAMPEP_0179057782 /NCGR_PEP_ID=MMETSP0796-20121207/24511_1 /TAXON_ID=73915 /ORGANISM="Pyrodinium bahamense, Strain pbaha01" /LENGTH=31 /DNA_ID= /DNA_START= /DNA_END= /DNA_ORIENTATION=